jgi:predicted Rossmann fold flavoprotein
VTSADLVVVGAGAAGLATAIFAARAVPDARIICLDGARRIGAKILVSGGARCNVTNRVVTERDFWGGSPRVVRRVLRAFPAPRAAAFFQELGVALHEEEDGKLFPDTNRSRDVLDALLDEAARLGVVVTAGARVSAVDRRGERFVIRAGDQESTAPRVVLATGGRSLPKTGSDGFGYELARRLGHGYVETTPALAPLLLDNHGAASRIDHAALAGVSHPAAMTLRVNGRITVRLEGPLLWTHVGVSGPLALNMSRHWHRARIAGGGDEVVLNVLPGETFSAVESWLLEQERARPRAQVATVLGFRLPATVAEACVAAAAIAPDATMAHLSRDERRTLTRVVVESPLAVTDSRGYAHAEVTAGGVPLEEIDPATMESRLCAGLHLVGEMLDVDGRLGGFNFQWAWSSGWIAGTAIGQAIRG